jgi:hypothetical protein
MKKNICLSGESREYICTDNGNTEQLKSCEAKTSLYLKVNAPVTLIVNLSDTLVNGRRGTVKEMKAETVVNL